MGTRTHQTALFVVFESELQMVADSPAAYDGQKEIEFLKAVPASWDETRVLNGVPAKYITIARRRGNEWFMGSITDWDARELDVPLSFLASGAYDAEIYSDGPKAATQPTDSVAEKRRVNAQTILKLRLAPAGGSAIRLRPGSLIREDMRRGRPRCRFAASPSRGERKMKASILFPLVLVCVSLPAVADVTVASPDGKVQFVLSSNAQGHLQYKVTFNAKNIFDPSALGIVVDRVDLADGAQIGASEAYRVNETYPWYGVHSTAVNNCNGAKVAVKAKTGAPYTLEIRAYNDGIAFRHLVPGQGARTPDEATVFRVPMNSVIAAQNYVSGYEGSYPWRTTTNRSRA